jgi:hypothetical protein
MKQATQTKGPALPDPSTSAPSALAEKQQAGALALAADFAADAGKGMEGADKDSFQVPFLAMLQGLSPAVVDSLVDGAKPGLMMNTVSGKLYAVARVIPVAFKRSYLRWTPRDEGGGFKGEISVAEFESMVRSGTAKEEETPKGGKVWKDAEGNELRDTRVHFCLILDDEGIARPIIISCGRTQIKRSKRFMTLINDIVLKLPDGRAITPPSFSHVYTVKSEKESNDDGTWFSFNFALEGPVTNADHYQLAKKFHEQFVAGKVKVNHDAENKAAGEGSGTGGAF